MMSVLHHPCGKREVLAPGEPKPPCPACDALFAKVESRWSYRDSLRQIDARNGRQPGVFPLPYMGGQQDARP